MASHDRNPQTTPRLFCPRALLSLLCLGSTCAAALAFASLSTRWETATATATAKATSAAALRYSALSPRRVDDDVVTPAAGAIMVNSAADVANSTDGFCTLREAITAANTDTASGVTPGECAAGSGDDTINFSVTGTINLTSALPAITSNILLNGPGASLLTIQRSTASGTPDFRIFNVAVASPGVVTFSGLTIANGLLFFGVSGAGILNNGTATINVTNSTLNNNFASNHGGGIFNNSAGTVNVANSALNNNTASSDGGGIDNFGNGTINVTNSTFSTNDAGSNGGGISNSDTGTLNVTNSTFNNNSAFNGGGISNFRILNVTNGTFTKNKAKNVGGGISSFGSSQARIRNSIIALNTPGSGRDVIGTFITQGHNLIGEIQNQNTGFTAGTNNANGDLVGTNAAPINPLLASLANYGGPTQTLALLPGSPAIDAGDNCVTQVAHCGDANITQLTTDQRGAGFNRSVDGNGDGTATVDIGAFESRGFTVSVTSGTPQSTAINSNFGAPLVANVSSTAGEPVAGALITFTAPTSGPGGTFAGSNTATVTADANGVATSPTFTANSLAGNYNVIAGVQGNPNTASFSLTNTQAATTTAVISSVNPSDLGQSVIFTATVASGAGQQPTLFVANLNSAQEKPPNNSTATGTATLFLSADQTTAHVLLNFTGLSSAETEANIRGSNALFAMLFKFRLPDGSPSEGSTSVVPSDVQALKNGEVYADVQSNNFPFGEIRGYLQTSGNIPTGTVQFKIDGSIFGSPVPLNSGVAQLTTSSLAPGTHAITADYSGDANFTSSAGTLAGGQVVKPPPSLSINDVSITEGDAGTKTLNFTVTGSAASNATASVNFATANGTASAPTDYVATNGTLTFNPGDLTKTIGVTINGDQTFEPDESFFVNLSSAVNATISVARGTGTILNDDAQGGIISLSQTSYSVSESAGFTTIDINRGGDTSGPATVDYATNDTGPLSACGAFTGQASSRCDYTTAMGTLKFAGGETQKTFVVLVSRDSYADGSEMFTVSLSNLTGGAVLGTPSTAPVTITDDTTGVPANAIDDASIFVRQHYHDFLNREPDASGLAFWTNQITSCGADAQCTELRRINVSAAFYLSIEFQQTGYLVERIYKASYGDAIGTSNFGGAHQLPVPIIRLNEFLPDTQQIGQGVVVGQTGWEQALENNKVAFTTGFVQRARFTSPYPTFMTPAEFVDKLFLNAGMMPAKPERQAAIDEFGGASTTVDVAARGRALRRVAENATLSANEFNRAFVLMEYFGYLRRNLNEAPDSDYTGYDFWLTKLNQFNGNFVNAEMVKAFINSGEYRQRFGP